MQNFETTLKVYTTTPKSTQLRKNEFERRFHLGPGQWPARVSYVFVFSMSILYIFIESVCANVHIVYIYK